MHEWRSTVARWLAPALLGIVAFALVLEITDPPGPGLDPDALAYMGSAQSFALHGEFRNPTASALGLRARLRLRQRRLAAQ